MISRSDSRAAITARQQPADNTSMQAIGLGEMPHDAAATLRQLPHLLRQVTDMSRSASGSIHVRIGQPALTRAELLTLGECLLLSRVEPVGAGGFKVVFHRDHHAAADEMLVMAARAREAMLSRALAGDGNQAFESMLHRTLGEDNAAAG